MGNYAGNLNTMGADFGAASYSASIHDDTQAWTYLNTNALQFFEGHPWPPGMDNLFVFIAENKAGLPFSTSVSRTYGLIVAYRDFVANFLAEHASPVLANVFSLGIWVAVAQGQSRAAGNLPAGEWGDYQQPFTEAMLAAQHCLNNIGSAWSFASVEATEISNILSIMQDGNGPEATDTALGNFVFDLTNNIRNTTELP